MKAWKSSPLIWAGSKYRTLGLRDSSDLTFREIGGKFAIDKDTTRWLYYHRHTAIDAIAREFLPR
ncbi:hypothetical protein QL297_000171 [Salmonella enterica]|nr:hypothetical protein [Salmonella enterica]ELW7225963.1 hypothetical protein [Salmonella enterica]